MQALFNKLQNLEKLSCVPMRNIDKYMCQIMKNYIQFLEPVVRNLFYTSYLFDDQETYLLMTVLNDSKFIKESE